ncbi:unnamed protein product [Trichobilharzia regenti]|nr:unnamed protein product [Trichobilharzia regenti]
MNNGNGDTNSLNHNDISSLNNEDHLTSDSESTTINVNMRVESVEQRQLIHTD